jgi:hypothetical protein
MPSGRGKLAKDLLDEDDEEMKAQPEKQEQTRFPPKEFLFRMNVKDHYRRGVSILNSKNRDSLLALARIHFQ